MARRHSSKKPISWKGTIILSAIVATCIILIAYHIMYPSNMDKVGIHDEVKINSQGVGSVIEIRQRECVAASYPDTSVYIGAAVYVRDTKIGRVVEITENTITIRSGGLLK